MSINVFMIAECQAFQGQATCLFDFEPDFDFDLDFVRLIMDDGAAECVSMFSKALHAFIPTISRCNGATGPI
jgi:hypothetical protein